MATRLPRGKNFPSWRPGNYARGLMPSGAWARVRIVRDGDRRYYRNTDTVLSTRAGRVMCFHCLILDSGQFEWFPESSLKLQKRCKPAYFSVAKRKRRKMARTDEPAQQMRWTMPDPTPMAVEQPSTSAESVPALNDCNISPELATIFENSNILLENGQLTIEFDSPERVNPNHGQQSKASNGRGHMNWCIMCGKGRGDRALVRCKKCAASFHNECRDGWSYQMNHRRLELKRDPTPPQCHVCPCCHVGPEIGRGDVVWAHQGISWWPARILDDAVLPGCLLMQAHGSTALPLEFIGDAGCYAWGDAASVCIYIPDHCSMVPDPSPKFRLALHAACKYYFEKNLLGP